MKKFVNVCLWIICLTMPIMGMAQQALQKPIAPPFQQQMLTPPSSSNTQDDGTISPFGEGDDEQSGLGEMQTRGSLRVNRGENNGDPGAMPIGDEWPLLAMAFGMALTITLKRMYKSNNQ